MAPKSTTAAPKSTANPTAAADPTGVAEAPEDDDHDADDKKKKGENSGGKHRRMSKDLRSVVSQYLVIFVEALSSSLNPRLDADDPGFVDTPVTAQFKFNGMCQSLYRFFFPLVRLFTFPLVQFGFKSFLTH